MAGVCFNKTRRKPMALAGRYLSAAQKSGDSALLLPLLGRQVHKPTGQINYNNIQDLATEARRQLKVSMETGNIKKQPITPNLLYRKADEIIAGIDVMDDINEALQ